MKLLLSLFIALIVLISGAVSTQAKQKEEGLFSKLFSPGPLIIGHVKLEGVNECTQCHDTGSGIPDSKCVDCHKELKPFIEKKEGFHGLHKEDCIKCHSDHQGRKFDSTTFDEDNFDHDLTGYEINKPHEKLKCSECHTEKRKKKPIRKKGIRFFGLKSTCVKCHEKDDVHFFKGNWKKKDCNACHKDDALKFTDKTTFDHFKETDFKHEGKHKKLKCAECHVTNTKKKTSRYEWKGLKTQKCLSCHDNHHKNNLSPKFRNGKCTDCHSQETWKIEKFDHKASTKWPLNGAHGKIKCTDCHKQTNRSLNISNKPTDTNATNAKAMRNKKFKWTGLKKDCISCHKDFHLFGRHKSKVLPSLTNCLTCHDENKWKNIHDFKHNKDTRWKINGKHEENSCNTCHIPAKRKSKTVFKSRRSFGQYYWPKLKQNDCNNCHKNPHTKTFSKKMLKKKCSECHVSQGWLKFPAGKKGSFNHDDTRFKLTDKHLKVSCNSCHVVGKKEVYKFPSFKKNFCNDCHDNQHKTQFRPKFYNQACSNCHDNKSFKKIKPFDHKKTKFDLKGKHKWASCNDCHTETTKRFNPTPPKKGPFKRQFILKKLKKENCYTCHKKDDTHNGQLSKDCSTCHTEKNWTTSLFKHNEDSTFLLKGKHKKVSCNECHKPLKKKFATYTFTKGKQRFKKLKKKVKVTRYKPISDKCATCHKDPHKGEFGKTCQNCHSEKSWKKAKDFHKNFTLNGIHYSLECSQCHIDQKQLGGMSQNCQLCHQKDDIHSGGLPNCNECHKQNFWENADFKHSFTNFPLRGSHRQQDCVACHSRGIYQGQPGECIDCHLADAQAVTSPAHTLPAFQDCQQCHNQFIFDLGQ